MSQTDASTADHQKPGLYKIRIKGHFDDRWADWFEGLTITREENGDTLLTGLVVDQAALYGVLRKVRDLGLPLLSVNRLTPIQADAADGKQQIGNLDKPPKKEQENESGCLAKPKK